MFLDRYCRRRRWIVGCVMVSIAVVTMLLAPPPSAVSVILSKDSSAMTQHKPYRELELG